jgi:hypothetical protein
MDHIKTAVSDLRIYVDSTEVCHAQLCKDGAPLKIQVGNGLNTEVDPSTYTATVTDVRAVRHSSTTQKNVQFLLPDGFKAELVHIATQTDPVAYNVVAEAAR